MNKLHPPTITQRNMMEEIAVETDATGNIWLTSKARMEAEKRFKHYDVTSHLVLIWYSLWLLCLSIFSELFEPYVGAVGIDNLATFLSASVLVLSVTTWGFKFGSEAALHRDCYLELDELLAADSSDEEKQNKYSEILKKYPNHSTFDRDTVLHHRITEMGETLKNREGEIKFLEPGQKSFKRKRFYGQAFRAFAYVLPFIVSGALYAL